MPIWRQEDLNNISTSVIFIDIIEYVNCIIEYDNFNMNYIKNNLIGEIKIDNEIAGEPEITLKLNIKCEIEDYSLHSCLFKKKELWDNE